MILDHIALHEVESVTQLQSSIQHYAAKEPSGVQLTASASALGIQPAGPGHRDPLADKARGSPRNDARHGLLPRNASSERELSLSAIELSKHHSSQLPHTAPPASPPQPRLLPHKKRACRLVCERGVGAASPREGRAAGQVPTAAAAQCKRQPPPPRLPPHFRSNIFVLCV